jgi:hypothetical protein
VQVQHWLGHHSAAFTLATYVHLLDGTLQQPLKLSAGYQIGYQTHSEPVLAPPAEPGETALQSQIRGEPESGFEPLTPCLQDRRSTN